MDIVYTKFIRGLRWNTLESLWYQFALVSHQVILFSLTPSITYGLIGTLFSTLYLILSLTNFGLDSSLGTFFPLITKNKKSFRAILAPQIIPEITIFSCIAFIFANLRSVITRLVPALENIDQSLIIILSALIILEGLKKTLRTLLQLAFYNNFTALIEIATITTYVSIVWGGYLCGYPLSLTLIFMPMLITSCMSTIALAYTVYTWYLTLDEEHEEVVTKNLAWRIIKSRFFNYINQVSHVLFSGNFLVPLFALRCGLAQAGVFKLLYTVAYGLSGIIQKIFGLSTDALLAQAKEMNLVIKQDAFKKITRYLYQALYGIIIFVCINAKKIVFFSGTQQSSSALGLVILFFIIHFSEHFFMVYEKFFIIEEKTAYLCIFNTITIALIYALLWYGSSWSPLMILTTLLSVRVLSFALLSSISFYTWQLIPTWRINPRHLILLLLISLAVFFC